MLECLHKFKFALPHHVMMFTNVGLYIYIFLDFIRFFFFFPSAASEHCQKY